MWRWTAVSGGLKSWLESLPTCTKKYKSIWILTCARPDEVLFPAYYAVTFGAFNFAAMERVTILCERQALKED